MHHYGAITPKPHYGFANSPVIGRLNKGPMVGWKRKITDESMPKSSTCEIYHNAKGEKRYKGTKALKKTEIFDYIYGFHQWFLLSYFLGTKVYTRASYLNHRS